MNIYKILVILLFGFPFFLKGKERTTTTGSQHEVVHIIKFESGAPAGCNEGRLTGPFVLEVLEADQGTELPSNNSATESS